MRRLAPLLLTALLMFGCTPAPVAPVAVDSYPPDLSLVVHIDTAQAEDLGPLTYPGLFVLEPDRKLRVTLGEGAATAGRGRVTAELTHAQMRAVYDAIADTGMLWHPEQDTSDGADGVYRVRLTADGRTLRYTEPVQDAASTRAVLAVLIEQAGLEPTPAPVP